MCINEKGEIKVPIHWPKQPQLLISVTSFIIISPIWRIMENTYKFTTETNIQTVISNHIYQRNSTCDFFGLLKFTVKI